MAKITERQVSKLRQLLIKFKQKNNLKRLRNHEIEFSEASYLIGTLIKE